MCGFAGEFVFGAGEADQLIVGRMGATLTHRGPDEEGTFVSGDRRCAIAFRRLSVIDPPESHQPMTSSDGKTSIAFNGEIYNFRQLREKLSAAGARFRTHGDTEVLLELFRAKGIGALEELVGMFAFAAYDANVHTLTLARDRLGQKPLWYSTLPDRIVFASEPKALLLHPGIDKTPDRSAIAAFCTIGYVPAPSSAWSGIRKLAPGSSLVCSAAGPAEPVRYWTPKIASPSAGLSMSDAVDKVRDQLEQAVNMRMVSDVPLGALLSGGVDSAVVVALMSAAAGKTGGVKTFTACFDDPRYNEGPIAKRVAEHCNTDHTELRIAPDPRGMLDWVVDHYDEPFADSSAIPTHLISRAAREHVTVALTGDGGDEAFAGYDRYRAMHMTQNMSVAKYIAITIAAAVARRFASKNERSRRARLVRFAAAIDLPPAVQYFKYRRLFGPDELLEIFSNDFLASGNVDVDAPAEWFCDLYESGGQDDEVANAQLCDLATYLPDDLLVKSDIASMAASLELRAPMLDHRVIELALNLPTETKLNSHRGKLVLREAFAHMLPPGAFDHPKRGFGVPLGDWLRNELRDEMAETLNDPALEKMGLFDKSAMNNLMNAHLAGRRDYSHQLWAMMVLGRWFAKFGGV
ncbi:MAG: asparagine synthase (glutamine-hydrolyzing) [Phycisphaerae bacterium]|nr:asparagine synthase (glutamine-hydrolyzing) [Phycisphaerae bacterium]